MSIKINLSEIVNCFQNLLDSSSENKNKKVNTIYSTEELNVDIKIVYYEFLEKESEHCNLFDGKPVHCYMLLYKANSRNFMPLLCAEGGIKFGGDFAYC